MQLGRSYHWKEYISLLIRLGRVWIYEQSRSVYSTFFELWIFRSHHYINYRPNFLFFLGKHCCAIDFILYSVDSATALLNSPRTFPSRKNKAPSVFTHTYTFFLPRLQIPVTSHRHFFSLARRLGRIFTHA